MRLDKQIAKLEGEHESSEDDIDIVKTSKKEVGNEVDLLSFFKSSDGRDREKKKDIVEALLETDTASGDSDHGFNRKRSALPEGRRVSFSDDEAPDAAYEAFKKRKTDRRKKAAQATRKARAKVTAKENSTVGRRSLPLTKPKDGPAKLRKHDTYATDSDEDLMETTLPDFLKERRSKWEVHREELGSAGLHLPPEYDGIYFSDDERIEDLRERPVLPGVKPSAPYEDVELRYSAGIVPAPIAQYLRDYQVKGAEFLHELFVFQKGGILCDDMGLGKTIQVIAFLTAAFGKTGDERDAKRMRKVRRMADGRWYPKVLIVCPGSLMANWKSELARWGYWQADVYHGNPTVRDAVLNTAKQGRLEIMITTYHTYRINKAEVNLVDWDCVVADECHQIKDRSSETTKAMNEINALCRIGLTGTAIQNKYEELWTLLNWTNPGRFGPLSAWKASISEPLKMGQSHDATNAQLAKARKTAEKLVTNLLPNFFLRRMKTLIADQLPKKSDKVVFCPLTEVQAQAYENLVDSELIDYIRTSSDPCDCNSGKKRGWCCYMEIPGHGKWQNNVFPCLATLQKLSNHLAMLLPVGSDPKDRQEKDIEILQIASPKGWKELVRSKDSIMNFANQDFCGKWKVLKKLLRFWHQNGDKVLVFSHSVRLLKMLQMLFGSTTHYNVSYLDGAMSYEERARTVDDFNANPRQFVFLISTKAGGVGLNITSANKVVIVDPNWNPSYDLQAQDRAYRIGQTRDVEVFRLISAGTVEEIVYARQIYKQQQANIAYTASLERRYFRGVQDQKEKRGEIFGLANLFSYQGDNVVLREIVNKTNVAESKAGVSVIGLDMDASKDDDDEGYESGLSDDRRENAAMSQMAEWIANGDDPSAKRKADGHTPKKIDAVQAILAGAGVEYTHENSEVIGSSKIEAKLSKRAKEAGNDIDVGGEYVFSKSQSQYDPDFNKSFDGGESSDDDGLGKIRYRYRPPEQVRKRQFVSMARACGFEDATDFALLVEGWTQEQRRNCLDRFYRKRRKELSDKERA
ncbi:hypothetical protein H2203_006843 [Taxawa tesnikishii (nom. ined.)]|nr:hypothetical protein H2203_006843 [Dothideales sp. JES 119]